jgi:predicted ATP-grasp superfamily ATP-dependent carboligase
MKVLVTSANSALSLTIIRALGRRGIDVTAVSYSASSYPLSSKYCHRRIILPKPQNDVDRISQLSDVTRKEHFDVLLPLGDDVLPAAANMKKFLPYVNVPIAKYEVLKKANNKAEIMKLATAIGVPCPKTYVVHESSELDTILKEARFPIILKPTEGTGATGLKYAYSEKELRMEFSALINEYKNVLVQEFIPGDEYFVSVLFDKSSLPKRACVQRAIRVYPISGGQATMVETVEQKDALNAGIKILTALNYFGVAELDFILDNRDGKMKLLEINPRFWASLQGAITAGVDYPYELIRLSTDDNINEDLSYRVGLKCRNLLFGDLKHLVSVLVGRKSPKYQLGKIRTLLNFLKFHEDDSYYILSLDDPLPPILKIFWALIPSKAS